MGTIISSSIREKTMGPIKRSNLALFGVLLLTVAVAAALVKARAGKVETGFVVHEWGTFTTFAGSDGENLAFAPTAEDLPQFVHSSTRLPANLRGLVKRPAWYVLVSLETPVLYFYAERALTASVRVDFPQGQVTEWYPQASATPGETLVYDRLKILPGADRSFPMEASPSRYYPARETDAAAVEMTIPKDGQEQQQHEKFIFYRGAGNFSMPLTVVAQGQDRVTIHNRGRDSFRGCILVRVEQGQVYFQPLGTVAPNQRVESPLPRQVASMDQLKEEMVGYLVADGLYEKEARAMVQTWDTAWFGEEGTRVLYLVPRALTDAVLPLKIEPRPEATVRVLVGRHDFLTPEQERRIEELTRKLGQPAIKEADVQAIHKELSGMTGRFRDPAMTAAQLRLNRPL
jgi:hypothetical protein